jgi:hypothetical protein
MLEHTEKKNSPTSKFVPLLSCELHRKFFRLASEWKKN